MRFRAYHFLKNKDDEEDEEPRKETYGFKTANQPKQISLLKPFEEDLINLVSKVEFNKKIPPFQRKLIADARKINKSEKVFVLADKSPNVYEVEIKTYTDLLENSIKAEYKKDKNKRLQSNINNRHFPTNIICFKKTQIEVF